MKKIVPAFFIIALTISPLVAQKNELSKIQIFNGEAHHIIQNIPVIIGWKDNTHYIESIKNDNGEHTLLSVNVKTNVKIPYINDKEKVLIVDGDIFYTNSDGQTKQLSKTADEEKNPTLSPNKQWVAFTRNNNLFAINLETGKEIQYTTDGSDVILNGYASWVYYEEILGRSSNYRSFWWSPDSKYIAFFHCDDTKVPIFPIYSAEGQHGYLENTRYPKAGDPNPEVKVGIVPTDGGQITWADFNEKEDQYFGQPYWAPDSKSLWLQWMPRKQNNLKIYTIDPTTGKKQGIYNETQSTWVDWKEQIHFLSNNSGYIVKNDTDGWEQIYLYNIDGTLKQKLTNGKLWRTDIIKVDEKTKTVYFTSNAETSTRKDFYSVKFDGKDFKRLSFGDYTHNITLSPDAKYFITTYSNINTPPKIALYETNKIKFIKELGSAKGKEFDNYNIAMPEIVWIETPDGFKLPAAITLPHNINLSKKYPVLISIYGGPNSGRVSDSWKGINDAQWWAQEGLIQITIDHRGAGHNGKQGLNQMYRNLGKWEMEDYIQWVKWLYTKPYVNQKKIAITGGSYGGYVAALALTYGADYFNYGIADFGVMDWHLYDSHYTERYMDTPQNNPDGYENSSVLKYIDKYKNGEAMLQIVHGTTDDNVHLQNSIQLIKVMQEANKTFEMMLYPDCRHGWGGPQRIHKRNENYRFYYRYLLDKEMPKDLYLQ